MELAVIAARTNREQGWTFVDRAMDDLLMNLDAYRSHGSGGGAAGMAAQMAFHARRIGYPDVHGLIARALSLRDLDRDFGRDHRSTVQIALALSGPDPASAKHLLFQTWSRNHLLSRSTSGDRNILFTLVLCDPPTCRDAVKLALGNPKNASRMSNTGIVEMLLSMTEVGREYEAIARWSSLMYQPIDDIR